MLIPNKDWQNWQKTMHVEPEMPEEATGANRAAVTRPRPGHADLAGALKYDLADIRDVLERASARETAARVAVGSLARQLLAQFGIDVLSHVTMIGGVGIDESLAIPVERIRAIPADSPLGCADAVVEQRDDRRHRSGQGRRRHARRRVRGRRRRDCRSAWAATCSGIASSTAGWRRPSCRFPRSRPSASARGPTWPACPARASTTRSCRAPGPGGTGHPAVGVARLTNNAGGLEGGVTNGEQLRVTGYMKPIATLMKPLRSVDLTTLEESPAAIERSDVCAVTAAAVVGEAMVSLVVADAFLEKFTGDSLGDITRTFEPDVRGRPRALRGGRRDLDAGRRLSRHARFVTAWSGPSSNSELPRCSGRPPPSPTSAADTQQIIDDMIETMHAAPGIGLAAPQVGVPLRLFVVDLSVGRTAVGSPGLRQSRDRGTRRHAARGGRLSERAGLHGHRPAARAHRRARRWIATAASRTVEGTGLLARALQHELDHLDGLLYVAAPARPAARRHRAARAQARAPRPMVTHAPLRIVFFGTPEFAVPTLDGPARLAPSRRRRRHAARPSARPRTAGHGQPGEGAGARARRAASCSPRRCATRRFWPRCARCDADLGVVAAYGRILTDAMLAIPRLGMVNVHASLLPRWRGAAPIHRAILAGDTETGVTIMRVVRELDAGPMMATLREPIGPAETTGEVERALAARGAQLAGRGRRSPGRRARCPKSRSRRPASPTPIASRRRTRRSSGGGRLARSTTRSARCNPWPLASTSLDGARLLVVATEAGADAAPAGALPGTVLAAHGDRFVVAAGHGTLQLLTVKPEGKRAMAAREFLAGHPVPPGTVLG